MGELDGRKSAWAYVEGGMGKLSQAIADSATSLGATILTNKVHLKHVSKSDRLIYNRTDAEQIE